MSIWLIGGTGESAAIADKLAERQLACIVTVTTEAAKALYPRCAGVNVKVGQLDSGEIERLLEAESIVAIVDASHPYAVAISSQAIAAAFQRNIPYLRYERPRLPDSAASVIELDSFATLINGNYLHRQRVLLTVGYKTLPQFQPWQDRATLFARILPAVRSFEVATEAGFSSDRLIALRPPVSAEVEKALWQQWDISLVVTKASGAAGGEAIKRSVAAELGIPLIAIARPKVAYPQQTDDLLEVLAFCYAAYA